jgi:CSLREA domain-containing protein
VLLASGVALATDASQIGTTAAPGTTIVVNSKGDGAKTGNCTLREAIGAANTNEAVDGCKAGSTTQRDAIHFSIGEEATIVLGSELPLITDASGLTINGQKKAKITVSGNDAVRVLHVGEGAKLAIANLTVAHGRAFSDGGGIRSSYGSTLKVTNATFSDNSASSDGGGIFSNGQLTVTNATFSENTADRDGGGILNQSGYWATVTNSTFSGNTADGSGGGIFGDSLGVSNSTFSENSASSNGGGIYNHLGQLEVSNTTFSGNSTYLDGGGIYNHLGQLGVTNTTFYGNSARIGGGIFNSVYGGTVDGGTLKVTNATFSENSAGYGGGIFNEFGKATLRNTILANSSGTSPGTTSGGNCYGVGGAGTDGGYNIEDGTSCYFSEANNSMPSTEPLLADSLANNGGPTKTIKLLEGSPAINAIPEDTNGCGTEITKDQRGAMRPQGEGCDVGAFERVVRR